MYHSDASSFRVSVALDCGCVPGFGAIDASDTEAARLSTGLAGGDAVVAEEEEADCTLNRLCNALGCGVWLIERALDGEAVWTRRLSRWC